MKENKLILFKILAYTISILSLINFIQISSLTNYTFLFLIIDIVLLIFFLCKKKKVYSMMLIIATISQLYFLPAIVPLHKSSKIDTHIENHLRVASLNTHSFSNGKYNTLEEIKFLLDYYNIDVVCFQEYREINDQDSLLFANKLSNYPYHIINKKDLSKARLAIFSKYPLTNVSLDGFRFFNNSVISGEITTAGKKYKIINTHLQTTGLSLYRIKKNSTLSFKRYNTNNSIRIDQISYIQNMISSSKTPIILCGDFNEPPTGYCYRIINRLLKDTFKEKGSSYPNTITGFFNLLRIDYIFHSKDIKCHYFYIDRHNLSDHTMQITELE